MLAVCIVVPLRKYDEFDRQMWRDTKLFRARTDHVGRWTRASEFDNPNDPNAPTTHPTELDEERLALYLNQLEAQLDAYLAQAEKAAERVRRLEAADPEHDRWHVKLASLRRWSYASVAGQIVGAVMMIVGFSLWWWKLQRHLDKAVKAKACESA